MNQPDISVDFRTTLELAKSVQHSTDEAWHITGIAAGTDVDREGDVITPEAIKQFAEQINTSFVPFRDWHQENTVLADMGQVVKAWIDDQFRLGVEIELDRDHPGAQYIWRKLGQGKQFGMSVRGRSTGFMYDFDKSTGARIRKHSNVVLSEISLTTKPIYTPSLGTVLRKAVDELATTEGVNMEPENVVVESVDDVPATQPLEPEVVAEAPAPEPEIVEDVEKSVRAETAREARKLDKLVRLHREMAELIAELGLDTADEQETADSGTTVETAKSEDEAIAEVESPDVASLVKSAIEENTAALRAEIESLKALIPETVEPGVLISKGEAVDPQQVLSELRGNPRQALRLGLAARHNELDRI